MHTPRSTNAHSCTFASPSIKPDNISRHRFHCRQATTRTRLHPTYNSNPIKHVSGLDVAFLKQEVDSNQYLQHGVSLKEGDTVFDIGANIGLFALYAAQIVTQKGHVIACEPLLPTFNALKANIQAAGSTTSKIVLPLNYGVSDGKSDDVAEFTLYTRAAGWGTMSYLEDDETILKDMELFLQNEITSKSGQHSVLPRPLLLLGRILHWISPRLFRAAARWVVKHYLLSSKQQYSCRLTTVSKLIKEYNVERVNLLKVDTERAELKVLLGIDQEDWGRIEQVAAEVHDENLTAVVDILKNVAGFLNVVVDQTAELKGTSIYNVYAHSR